MTFIYMLETICLEVTISKKKYCVTFTYKPPYNCIKDGFFKELNKSLSIITRKYENVLTSEMSKYIF